MTDIIFLVSLVASFLVIWHLLTNQNKSRTWQTKRKEENKEKILVLFQTKETVTNNDIEKLLGVSDATATRYLSELEKEGKLVQIGKTGRGVGYRRK